MAPSSISPEKISSNQNWLNKKSSWPPFSGALGKIKESVSFGLSSSLNFIFCIISQYNFFLDDTSI